MSVPKAILIGSVLIALAIYFIPVPSYSLIHSGSAGVFIRLSNTTGKTSVCTMVRDVDSGGTKLECNEPK